jgi:hypothetical protein
VRAQLAARPQTNVALRSCPDIKVAAGAVLELQVPFQCLGVSKESTIAFIVALQHGVAELEHYPRHQPIEVQVPDQRFASRNWTA